MAEINGGEGHPEKGTSPPYLLRHIFPVLPGEQSSPLSVPAWNLSASSFLHCTSNSAGDRGRSATSQPPAAEDGALQERGALCV